MADMINANLWNKIGVTKFEKFLDLTAHRHKLISGNLANVTTPGYVAQDFDFQKEINNALGTGSQLKMTVTSQSHLGNFGDSRDIDIIETRAQSEDDLNGVDLDTEITNLSINQMRFTIGAKLLQNKLSALKKAIRG